MKRPWNGQSWSFGGHEGRRTYFFGIQTRNRRWIDNIGACHKFWPKLTNSLGRPARGDNVGKQGLGASLWKPWGCFKCLHVVGNLDDREVFSGGQQTIGIQQRMCCLMSPTRHTLFPKLQTAKSDLVVFQTEDSKFDVEIGLSWPKVAENGLQSSPRN